MFEISEQESIANFDIFREVRDYYGKLGFQIALDDVGAGYCEPRSGDGDPRPSSSRSTARSVAKIDEDPGRQHLLRALQSLADRIGARIIGEGLDTLEELETLGRLGIHFGQGWLFGKPHPLRERLSGESSAASRMMRAQRGKRDGLRRQRHAGAEGGSDGAHAGRIGIACS